MRSKSVMVIAPHPDDETLGCGGSLLALRDKGCKLYWLIVTGMKEENGFSTEQIENREAQITKVSESYGFSDVIRLDVDAAKVDKLSKGELVQKFSKAFNEIKPNMLLVPFINDIHTDHKLVAEAVISCTKWFRYPYIEEVLYYETLSETEQNIDPCHQIFKPNVFIDITPYIKEKIEIMKIYSSEIGSFPFPRSDNGILCAAQYRGLQCGSEAAEAFQLLRANVRI